MGWYSGDHHVHAAGCAHYESPTEGVSPADMMRQILGEDLKVGCVLSWGPCWYAQKQYFEGKIHPLSTPDYLMRYDVEVSGFPSSHCGHLCLLRLKEDDYPGTTPDRGVAELGPAGPEMGQVARGGRGLLALRLGPDRRRRTRSPRYEIPPFDGIGANEYIVDVVHDAVDFISTVDTPALWELNIWYHTLNCGYPNAASAARPISPASTESGWGWGESYVKSDAGISSTTTRWADGLKQGRSYVTDGMSHLLDFQVGDVTAGRERQRAEARRSRVRSRCRRGWRPSSIEEITARGPRDPQPASRIRSRTGIWNGPGSGFPPRAGRGDRQRSGGSEPADRGRRVVAGPGISGADQGVELGGDSDSAVIAHKPGLRDGRTRSRCGPRKDSAAWCLKSVDQCWSQKVKGIRPDEQEAAEAAFEQARQTYRKILKEMGGE